MTEQSKQIENEDKMEKKLEEKIQENKDMAKESKNEKEKKVDLKADNKKPEKKVIKKEEAVAKGTNLHASKKHCMYICNFIKNKSIDLAINQLSEVLSMKRVIPFKGEIPHRRGKGMMSGRYPINATKEMIYVLKALKGNSMVNGLDLEKTRIYFASASWASRPAKRGGARFKRTHVLLKAKEITKEIKK
jgi:large subunit ribosomal protein L22